MRTHRTLTVTIPISLWDRLKQQATKKGELSKLVTTILNKELRSTNEATSSNGERSTPENT